MNRFTNANNPHLKRLDQLEAARKLWSQSESVLQFLRPISATATKELTDEELLIWYRKNNPEQN